MRSSAGPAYRTVDLEIRWGGRPADAEIAVVCWPGAPARRVGHPDWWTPAERGEYEIERVRICPHDADGDETVLDEGDPLLGVIAERYEAEIRAELHRLLPDAML